MIRSLFKRSTQKSGHASQKIKKVRRSVIIIDRIADKIITVGGVLVILAVLGIMVYLIKETVPLFMGGDLTDARTYQHEQTDQAIIGSGMDEYHTISYLVYEDGTLVVFHTKTGRILDHLTLNFSDRTVSTTSQSVSRGQLAFGFTDGSVQLAEALFPYSVVTKNDLPENLIRLDEIDAYNGATVYTKIPGGQYRKIAFKLSVDKPLHISSDQSRVVAMDYRVSGEAERKTEAFVVVDENGKVTLNRVKTRVNLLTGQKKKVISRSALPPLETDQPVFSVLMNDSADFVLVTTKDGRGYRYNTSNFAEPVLAEISSLLSGDATLSTMGALNGDQSIVIGGSDGSLNIYFIVNNKERGTQDGKALVKARTYHSENAPIALQLSPSSRGKSFAVGYNDGSVDIIHATSRKRLLHFEQSGQKKLSGIALSPRFDGILRMFEDGSIAFSEFSVPHPETTVHTLFQKVWYEGYPEPSFTWQSSAATDDYEQKLSLIPLIFGSFKAALYSLIFAVPIAILGAIYTSEFVDHKVRNTVKPAMEMMASLPSVVLGFVAALVLAPFVEVWISAVLAAFLVVPAGLVMGSFLWQFLPQYLTIRWQGTPKLFLIFLIILLSLFSNRVIGPWLENLLFYGNFRAWLNRDIGSAAPFLFLVILPLVFALCATLTSRLVKTHGPTFDSESPRVLVMVFNLIQWALVAAISIFVALELSHLLSFFGVEARGGLIDTYMQRNTLVVGFAMGFAVIPIIYTIAEDALHAVPDHLRAASLGCGATQWQTTIFVILPAAASGVFSAIMIGMGRAVGETMIVVMAAGNTPLMDWNIFNGLRALSATIAVELPEAVKDGTLYRVLFLAGLVLFAMTFVINTIAEIVRIRFRKKTTQL